MILNQKTSDTTRTNLTKALEVHESGLYFIQIKPVIDNLISHMAKENTFKYQMSSSKPGLNKCTCVLLVQQECA